MLVLSRKSQQKIQIGNNIVITILQVKGQAVRIGIEAPKDVPVLRTELAEKVAAELKNLQTAGGETNTMKSKPLPRAMKQINRLATNPGETAMISSENTRCRASAVRSAPLAALLKRTGPASFSTAPNCSPEALVR